MQTKLNFILGATAAILVGACTSTSHRIDNVPVSVSPSDNPGEQISALDKDIAQAETEQVAVLAPDWFEESKKALSEAKSIRDRGGDFREIFEKTAQSRAELDRAKSIAEVGKRSLADAIEARKAAYQARNEARQAGAVNLSEINEKLSDADNDFMKLTRKVQDGDVKDAEEDKREVVQHYAAVRGFGMKKEKLDGVRRIIETAKSEGAKKYAPTTLAFAEETLERTSQFIQNNPQASEEIQAKSNESAFYANRALQVTREAKEFSDKNPEEVVLFMEDGIQKLSTTVGAPDMRDKALSDQMATLNSSLAKVHAQVGDLSNASENLQTRLAATEGSAEFTAKVKQVRQMFDPAEAEVLLDGNKVIVRLKKLNFAVGKAAIPNQDFAVLSKVNKALAEFPSAQVLVEGHTDSTGGRAKNQNLSQERADTIKQYLVSQNNVDTDKLTAVGVGFEKPLTSNKTRQGRETNRRVDIVISPNQTAAAE